MKKIIIGSIIIFLILIAVVLFIIYIPVMTEGDRGDCNDKNRDNAVDLVKDDFLNNRIVKWPSLIEKLKTSSPKLKFKPPVTQNGFYFISFTAYGPDRAIKVFGIMDCKNGSIEYSVDD